MERTLASKGALRRIINAACEPVALRRASMKCDPLATFSLTLPADQRVERVDFPRAKEKRWRYNRPSLDRALFRYFLSNPLSECDRNAVHGARSDKDATSTRLARTASCAG